MSNHFFEIIRKDETNYSSYDSLCYYIKNNIKKLKSIKNYNSSDKTCAKIIHNICGDIIDMIDFMDFYLKTEFNFVIFLI